MRQYFQKHPVYLDKKVQTSSVEPTEYFGIYFRYIRRFFPRWVSPFKDIRQLME